MPLHTFHRPNSTDKVVTPLSPTEAYQAIADQPDAKKNDFQRSLCRAYPNLSVSQKYWFYKIANDIVNPQTKAISGIKVNSSFAKVKEVFDNAIRNGLKSPKLRLESPQGAKVVLSPAKATSTNPGFIYIKANDLYCGKISPDGIFSPSRDCNDETQTYLMEFAHDPLKAAKEYGRKTGNCCCCGRELTDPVSIANFIGPICAEKFGF